jgi:proliferating cell nuclear antigen
MQDSKVMKGIIEALSAIIDETYFVANEDGLTLTAMDESHICLMHLIMPKGIFDAFEADGESKMGINLEDLVKISKRAGQSDSIELKHPADSEKFQVVIKGVGTRTFSLRLVDIDEEKVPPTSELDVPFTAKATFGVGILDQAIKDAEIYQDYLEIKMTSEMFNCKAEGEVGDVDYQLDKENLESLEVTENARGVFSLAFLKNIMKISSIADKLTLSLSDNAPAKLQFQIAESDDTKAVCTYFLAPRVEEEDDESDSE